MHVSENRETIQEAKEVAFICNLCGKMAIAIFPYKPTLQERFHVMKEALDEHRKICTITNSEVKRIYVIERPRK